MKDLLFRDDQSLIGSNWYKLPKKLFVIPFILSFLGLFAIYSLVGSEYSIGLFLKHFFYLIISFFILFSITLISKNDLRRLLNILSLLFLILLILVPVFGYEVKGATRWINMKFFSIQPSELLKGPIICM
jgi:cell division protein FtsW